VTIRHFPLQIVQHQIFPKAKGKSKKVRKMALPRRFQNAKSGKNFFLGGKTSFSRQKTFSMYKIKKKIKKSVKNRALARFFTLFLIFFLIFHVFEGFSDFFAFFELNDL